jgi:hypothetical protein
MLRKLVEGLNPLNLAELVKPPVIEKVEGALAQEIAAQAVQPA